MKAYREALKKLAETKGFRPERRPLLERAFEFIISNPTPFLVLQAPTGYGKTLLSFSLALHSKEDASLFDRVIHVLPMRSIIEDVQKTAEEAFGFSRTKMMGSSSEFLHLFPLNITTADTFTWDLLKLNTKRRHLIKQGREFGYDYLTQASILTSLVIFDEAHFLIEDKTMRTAFLAVLEFLTSQRVPIVVMTATLAKAHLDVFKRYANKTLGELKQKNGYTFKVLSPGENDPFVERELEKSITIEISEGDPLNFIEPKKKNAIIVNSVGRAVEIYNEALKHSDIGIPEERIMLIHGRMTPSHKKTLIERLREWKQERDFLIIGTQAVEAGVDFSVEIMITDKAPINSLLQRFGRVARYGNEPNARITVLRDSPAGPYSEEKVEKTLELIEATPVHPRAPWTYQSIVTEVHGERMSSIMAGVNRSLKRTLVKLMCDPRKRSTDVLSSVEEMTVRGVSIMRGFLIPLDVRGETILITPKKLLELHSRGSIKIESWGREMKELSDAYRVAREIALGRDIAVVFTGEYDRERGLI